MAGEASAQREKQDQSIKARKNELFVEEQVLQTGPRKKLRDYLKDTPAAPLSKNVKLSLWGSAVPVVLLFVVALFSLGNRSTAKAPDEIIQQRAKPALPSLASLSKDKPPAPAVDTKGKDRKDDSAANTDKPPQEKPKSKKKPPKKGGKPKDTVVVQNTDGDKASGDEPNKDKGDKSSDSKKKPKTGSSGSDSKDKDKMASTDDAKSKSTTPEKPKQRAAPIFKKKKPEVRTYPKRDGEKKADPKTDPGDGMP
jgi:hypothetical protein